MFVLIRAIELALLLLKRIKKGANETEAIDDKLQITRQVQRRHCPVYQDLWCLG